MQVAATCWLQMVVAESWLLRKKMKERAEQVEVYLRLLGSVLAVTGADVLRALVGGPFQKIIRKNLLAAAEVVSGLKVVENLIPPKQSALLP